MRSLIVASIVFASLIVVTIGQTCRDMPMYARCSTNPDCGCLPFSSADDTNGICAYLHLDSSKLRTCNANKYYCDQPYTICVHHPALSTNKPLCYPTGMATLDICPPLGQTLPSSLSSTTTTTTLPPPTTTTISLEELCHNVSWTKQGLTVAGSNFSGSALNQLRNPTAILFDRTAETLYVADNGNARIVTWQSDAKQGTVVLGSNGQGNRTDQLGWVSSMLMDPIDGSLIICDARNRRIVRWPLDADHAEVLISNLYCTGLAFDQQGLLYVSEHENHRVTQWTLRPTVVLDGVVAGGNGKGIRLDQLNEPSSVFVDQYQTVYVADYSNDRLVKWPKGANEGILLGKIRWPKTIRVSPSGNVYSIDGYYNRVLRWTPGNVNGAIIVGEKQYTLSQPADLAFDQAGNVFISNYGSSRVEQYHIDESACF